MKDEKAARKKRLMRRISRLLKGGYVAKLIMKDYLPMYIGDAAVVDDGWDDGKIFVVSRGGIMASVAVDDVRSVRIAKTEEWNGV